MIVTIDGPAGAGKSSIARQVAQQLGFEFLDTGALYRAVTYVAIRDQIDLWDEPALVDLASRVELQWVDNHIWVDGEDVSDLIRTPEVTAAIKFVANPPAIRSRLSDLQRRIASGRNIVTEGRDQGTEVFPDAECKIFLTASSEERARRRQIQLAEIGKEVPLDEILAAQNRRDAEDESREVGRLRAAADAQTLCTDGLSPEDVLQEILQLVESAMHQSDACK